MYKYALIVILEAKPGKEDEVSALLRTARSVQTRECQDSQWFAFRTGTATFGVFHMFPDEKTRDAHLSGDAAGHLFGKWGDLFASPPRIESSEILTA